MPKPLTMSATEWIFLLILSVLWGGAFFFAKIAVGEITPLTLAELRVGVAALAIVPIAAATTGVPALREWRTYLLLGLLSNAVPFTLIIWSQTHITSGLASILNATTPLFTLVFAHLFTPDDRFTPGRIVGVVAGFCGVAIMIGPGLVGDIGTNVLAELASLSAALTYGIAGVYARRVRHIPPLKVMSGQLAASTLLLLPLALVVDQPWTLPSPSWAAIGATLALALLSTALAYYFFFRILSRAGATNVMLVTLLIPVSAILLGTFLLDESLTVNQMIGAFVIAIGLAAVDGRPARWIGAALRPKPATVGSSPSGPAP